MGSCGQGVQQASQDSGGIAAQASAAPPQAPSAADTDAPHMGQSESSTTFSLGRFIAFLSRDKSGPIPFGVPDA